MKKKYFITGDLEKTISIGKNNNNTIQIISNDIRENTIEILNKSFGEDITYFLEFNQIENFFKENNKEEEFIISLDDGIYIKDADLYFSSTRTYTNKESIIKNIEKEKLPLSKGFEKIGINRKEYFHETWKNLSPEKYLIKRNNKKLEKLIKSKEYKNIMITGAPKIWFQKSLKYLGYKENIFELIYTAEDFYKKKEIFEQLNKNNKFDLKKSVL